MHHCGQQPDPQSPRDDHRQGSHQGQSLGQSPGHQGQSLCTASLHMLVPISGVHLQDDRCTWVLLVHMVHRYTALVTASSVHSLRVCIQKHLVQLGQKAQCALLGCSETCSRQSSSHLSVVCILGCQYGAACCECQSALLSLVTMKFAEFLGTSPRALPACTGESV